MLKAEPVFFNLYLTTIEFIRFLSREAARKDMGSRRRVMGKKDNGKKLLRSQLFGGTSLIC
jgi:hypothetical protein